MTRPGIPKIRHRASSGRCGVQGRRALSDCSRSCGQRAKPDSGEVLASRMAPAIICIAPSTSQRLHLARRHVSFRGIDQSWGNYLAAAVLLSASLFCASSEKAGGPLKALNSAPGPNSSTPNFNLDKPPHQPKKCNATIGTKKIRLANHHLSPKPN